MFPELTGLTAASRLICARERFRSILEQFLPGLLAVFCFVPMLRNASIIRDDWFLIVENPLLRSPAGLAQIWTTGYCQASDGAGAIVSEYRPFTLLTFYLEGALFGFSPMGMRLTNILLHALNCLLTIRILGRFLSRRTAWTSALIFAAMPIHIEAVANTVNRTELLVYFWLVAAWSLLDRDGPEPLAHYQPKARAGPWLWKDYGLIRRAILGGCGYALALISKEHAILFLPMLAMGDWAFRGKTPWEAARRPVYMVLLMVTALYLAVRLHILARPFQGGVPYFSAAPFLNKCLTISRFWVGKYIWPSLTGTGLGYDFSRPLIPDSGPGDLWAWFCLISLTLVVFFSAWGLLQHRTRAGFWTLLPILFLLPTSHLLLPLDTLGAQRFFYLPSLAVAVGLGAAFDHLLKGAFPRLAKLTCASFIVVQTCSTLSQSRVWSNERTYYAEVTQANPLSAGARAGYGLALLRAGDEVAAKKEFWNAIQIDPSYFNPYYNLGKLAWERGSHAQAQELFRKALARRPSHTLTINFLGLAAESRGDRREAERLYNQTLQLQPYDAVALHNLGLLLWKESRFAEGAGYWRRFLDLFPQDPSAPQIRRFLSKLPTHSLSWQDRRHIDPIQLKREGKPER